jgi:hypothetical protein
MSQADNSQAKNQNGLRKQEKTDNIGLVGRAHDMGSGKSPPKVRNNMTWIYDIETYRNFMSTTFKNYKTGEVKVFVIYGDRNDTQQLINFIDDPNKWLVGYNNYNFDNQILKYMWLNRFDYIGEESIYITEDVYRIAKSIIEDNTNDYTWKLPFKFLDLMKIGNLGHKSLKLTGTVLKWPKLQDLPIDWDEDIKDEDVDTILKYNLNDVEITEALMRLLEPQIKMRFDVSKAYGVNAYTESDSGIANKLLEKFYSESSGLSVKEFKHMRTRRKKIFFSDVVFEDIQFETEELNTMATEIRENVMYEQTPFFKKSIVIDNVKYKLGIGGIHSDDKGNLFESNDEEDIVDADIASMYPSIIINNNIHPEHLGSAFIKKYKEVRDERVDAKHNGDKAVADTLKIALNSTYGKMKFENHWLYDPLAALRITINGQLYILMLIEKLVMNNFKVISANTDGIITIVPKDRADEYKDICKTWEKQTNFELEYTYYSKYARRDVNNYIAITTNGKIKTKGEFIVPDIANLPNDSFMLRRGFDKPIIAIALNEYFMHGKPVAETIKNHTDIYDFCISQKTDKKFHNEFHTIKDGELHITKLQQSVRYYISTNGGSLHKRDPIENKLISYCVGKRVTLFNDYFESDNYNIDYSYYIYETQKIIDQIIKPQLSLF